MSCGPGIRERSEIKFDGWAAYVDAVSAHLDADRDGAFDRLQAGKRRLREALERLERETNDTATLAAAVRTKVLRASSELRRELSSSRPDNAAGYRVQRQAIALAMAAMERELNAIGAALCHSSRHALRGAGERTVRAIVRLEAELEAGEMRFRPRSGGICDLDPGAEREVGRKLRALASAISVARRLTHENAKIIEAEITSGIGSLRDLLASRSA
jgi:hypothetical protein